MKIVIYRYPHPIKELTWLYTGQTSNLYDRDKRHRKAKTPFGRKFVALFPNVVLPQPESIEVDVASHVEANEEETIAIFRNHTWRGQGGMNVTLPGSTDYQYITKLAGFRNVESGQILRLRTPEILSKGGKAAIRLMSRESRSRGGRLGGLISGPIQGRKNAENGHASRLPHLRWHIGRGVINPKCKHCVNQDGIQ